jgi:hypothetical protein
VGVQFVWWAVRAGWVFPLLCEAGSVYRRNVLAMLCASLLPKLWCDFCLFVTNCVCDIALWDHCSKQRAV